MNQDYDQTSGGSEPSEPHPGPRGAEYIADPAEYVGLPAPDFGAASAFAAAEGLRARVRRIIRSREVGQISTEEATEAILAAVSAPGVVVAVVVDELGKADPESLRIIRDAADRLLGEASPRVSHEGATVSDAYTDRLTLHADDLDVPVAGPRWQVLDARDEQTWHDLDAVAECELGVQCPIAASLPSDVECIVLVGTAWGDGWAHTPADAMVDVRIPAAVEGGCE